MTVTMVVMFVVMAVAMDVTMVLYIATIGHLLWQYFGDISAILNQDLQIKRSMQSS